jgi:hypothetical protein
MVPVLFFLCSLPLFSQTTFDEVETLLAANSVTYSQAARFVLDASQKLTASDDEASLPQEAFQYALSRGWLPKNAQADGNARLDGVSLLCMNAFDLNGGVMYSIFKSPHHAFRELQYRNIIVGLTAPDMNVSGEQLLSIISRILASIGE